MNENFKLASACFIGLLIGGVLSGSDVADVSTAAMIAATLVLVFCDLFDKWQGKEK